MTSARHLVIGADGLIGRALCSALEESGIRPLKTTRNRPVGPDQIQLDLEDWRSRWSQLQGAGVAYLCAGITSIASCEADPVGTYATNVTHATGLLEALAAAGTFIVYPSTNLVFDGSSPYHRSNDLKATNSEYARQKVFVEEFLLQHVTASSIVRLSKVISATHPLIQRWRGDLIAGRTIEAFVDRTFAPLPVDFVAQALMWIGLGKRRGIWQLSSEREISYYDFALLLGDAVGADRQLVIPIPSPSVGLSDNQTARHTTLDCTDFLRESGLKLPSIESLVSGLLSRAETC